VTDVFKADMRHWAITSFTAASLTADVLALFVVNDSRTAGIVGAVGGVCLLAVWLAATSGHRVTGRRRAVGATWTMAVAAWWLLPRSIVSHVALALLVTWAAGLLLTTRWSDLR
jgi:hypothetical protein